MTGAAERQTEHDLADARRRRFAATVAADVDELKRLLSPDFTMIHALNAQLDSREAFINSLRERRLVYKQVTTEQDDVRLYGDTAVVMGIAHVVLDARGRDVPVDTRLMEVWSHSAGDWRLVACQATRLPQPDQPSTTGAPTT